MVNGVKSPQKRNFVQSQMNEVFGKVRDHNGQEKLQKPGQSSDKLLKNWNAQIFGGLGGGQQNEKRQNLDRQMRGHEINHILYPPFSERSLFWVLWPDSFQRHVNKRHQQQIEQKPVHADGHAIELAPINFYA